MTIVGVIFRCSHTRCGTRELGRALIAHGKCICSGTLFNRHRTDGALELCPPLKSAILMLYGCRRCQILRIAQDPVARCMALGKFVFAERLAKRLGQKSAVVPVHLHTDQEPNS